MRAPLREIGTRRLLLSRLGSEDLDELAEVFAERDVWRFDHDRGLTREESEAFLNRQSRMWAQCGFGGCSVRERASSDLAGVAGLGLPTVAQELLPEVTVGWRFSPMVWGRGYATEAATALLDEAFTSMGLGRVGCVTNVENRRSVAVAERLGMSVITDTTLARDDGTGTTTARLLHISREDWIANQDSRNTSA